MLAIGINDNTTLCVCPTERGTVYPLLPAVRHWLAWVAICLLEYSLRSRLLGPKRGFVASTTQNFRENAPVRRAVAENQSQTGTATADSDKAQSKN